MNIEHIAFNVVDPPGVAAWYGEHLGMRVLRKVEGATRTHFIADESGRVVLEFYHNDKAAVPDYRAQDPMVLHIAFRVDDVAGELRRLLAAGGSAAGEIVTTPAGDVMTFLRDPWGLALQMVKRKVALG